MTAGKRGRDRRKGRGQAGPAERGAAAGGNHGSTDNGGPAGAVLAAPVALAAPPDVIGPAAPSAGAIPAAVRSRCRLGAPTAMLGLLVLAFFLRVLWLDHPSTPSIFDESYYVPAARVMLGIHQGKDSRYADVALGKDPNPEHPPLGKALIAWDIVLAGDNPWGWRWASIVTGTLAVAFLYRIGRSLGLGGWAAVLAAFAFAFDNLVFVTSRMGVLDVPMLLGMLAGAAFMLRRQPILAGLAFAFGTLCKEYGVYGPAIMACFAIARALYQRPDREELLRRGIELVVMGVTFLASFLALLWLLDRRWDSFTNPLAHLQSIWSYGTNLTNKAGPTGIASWPWQWLVNEVQINYLTTTVTVCSPPGPPGTPCPPEHIVREFASIYFRGALNPYLIAGLPLALGYALTRLKRGDNRNALLALVWFAVSYLPFIPAAVIDHRITYLYYMLPVVPAIALASAQFFTDPRVPRLVTWTYVAALAYGFGAYFPFVGFHL